VRVVVDVLDGTGWIIAVLLLVVVAVLVRRTVLRRRGATLHCGLRMGATKSSRGWQTGMARYTPEDLQWFRLFSLGYQAHWTFVRRSIEIRTRRYPHGAESLAVPHGAVIISCNVVTRQGDSVDVELAMSDAAVTGFLAWIESSAPGAHSHPDSRV
jgi:hypothetical protein